MKKTHHIIVVDRLSELLNSREAASKLFNIVKQQKADRFELDFNDIEFMSRSFADQFHKERTLFEKSNDVVIEILNANEEIIKMLKTVARTQNKTKRAFVKLPVFKYSNAELLSDYLLSV